jgi:hypothetical protein
MEIMAAILNGPPQTLLWSYLRTEKFLAVLGYYYKWIKMISEKTF